MAKYALIFEDEYNKLIFVGTFIGNNHYKIKFKMFQYIKDEFKSKGIILYGHKKFGIYEFKKNIIHWYEGSTKKIKPQKLGKIKIKSILQVNKISEDNSGEIFNKINSNLVQYENKINYKETLEDEWSAKSNSAFGSIE